MPRPIGSAGIALAAALLLPACSGSAPAARTATPAPAPAPVAAVPTATPAGAAPAPTAAPTPTLPAYYIESLRATPHPGGNLVIGDQMFRGAGFTKFHMAWPSAGETMTGTISLPDGSGPFPVVIVNHGHIPVERYWIGQDSGIFGDPLAAHGFISLAPNYPGYSGSGPVPHGYPDIVGQALTVMDLVSSLGSLPQADTSRVAIMGHSNGGGVSQLVVVADPRVKAAALYAPVSSDMRDNSRKWWLAGGSMGPLGNPDDPAAKDAYDHISPRNYFAGGGPPILLLQGVLDQDIPAAWTQATFDALTQRGVKSKLVWFPGAQHDLVGTDLDTANAMAEAWVRTALDL